jgi:glycosyltransferase involved in cell wall biosynthesis
MDSRTTLVSLVCPVFNEGASVDAFLRELTPIIESLAPDYAFEVVFVDDGSTDATLERLLDSKAAHPWIRVIELSRNFGKEAALSCGLDEARGDCVVPVDVDLEDPLQLIPVLLARWKEGFEVVLARRGSRPHDSWLKRTSARMFYRIHNRMSVPVIPEDVGDFRLLDRSVVDVLRQIPERQRFMKGLFAWVGFRQATVDYIRGRREGSESRYNFWRLWNLALEGITSFSTLPLRIWSYIGLAIAMAALGFGVFIVAHAIVNGRDVPGYASLMTVVLFLGGMQLIGLGVIGEYLGRNYMESKQRPVYVVRRRY